jgi:hypothetical protein
MVKAVCDYGMYEIVKLYPYSVWSSADGETKLEYWTCAFISFFFVAEVW